MHHQFLADPPGAACGRPPGCLLRPNMVRSPGHQGHPERQPTSSGQIRLFQGKWGFEIPSPSHIIFSIRHGTFILSFFSAKHGDAESESVREGLAPCLPPIRAITLPLCAVRPLSGYGTPREQTTGACQRQAGCPPLGLYGGRWRCLAGSPNRSRSHNSRPVSTILINYRFLFS